MDEILLIDRKSTRLNSSHPSISYAVFCLKKKKRFPFAIVNEQHFIPRDCRIGSRVFVPASSRKPRKEEKTQQSFFFNQPGTTGIYTLSLHDALPISIYRRARVLVRLGDSTAIPALSGFTYRA